jgi:hypothetical protein
MQEPEPGPETERRPEPEREASTEQEQAAQALGEALDKLEEHAGTLARGGIGAFVGAMLLGRARRSLRRLRPSARFMRRFGFGLLIVVLSVTTCSYGVDPVALTAPYGQPVTATTQDATRVLNRGVDVLRAAPDAGGVRFTVTESEATSALSIGLMMSDLMQVAGRIPREEIQEASDLEALRERIWYEAQRQREEVAARSGFAQRVLLKLDPRIRTGNIQVRFEGSGEVVVAGYVQAWRFRQPGIFVVKPSARNGEIDLDFVSGRLGRLPVPELVFDWFGEMVARTILLGRSYAEVSELSVGDGTLTFAARVTG